MNRKPWYFHLLVAGILVILQTTLFRFIEIRGASPDLVLIFLVFSAHSRGSWEGQLLGFFTGLIEDFMSLAPFGFNTLTRTITGFLFGKSRGEIFFDPLFMPMVLILVASLVREGLMFLVSFLFLKSSADFFHLGFWIELGMNLILAPFIFNLFKKTGFFTDNKRNSI